MIPETLHQFLMENISERDMIINEGVTSIKRKYRDRPSINIYTNAPVRNSILSYVGNEGIVTNEELEQLFNRMHENGGKRPNGTWLKRNSDLFKTRRIGEIVVYSLSKKGKRIYDSINISEIKEDYSLLGIEPGMGGIKLPGGVANSFVIMKSEPGSGDKPSWEDEDEDESDENRMKEIEMNLKKQKEWKKALKPI